MSLFLQKSIPAKSTPAKLCRPARTNRDDT
jgi:hypothetical protein